MRIKKSIQLTTDPFDELLAKGETIDFRLDEPQWADLKSGDTIEFWEDFSGWDKQPSKTARKILVIIIDIFHASSFDELLSRQDLATFFRDYNKDKTLASLRQWWTPEKEKQKGVLGLRVKLIPSCG